LNDLTSPCRLSVFLARGAPTAVVLRRGPSAWAHQSIWNRLDDSVQHGQWFRGRVYGRRCDVSPDGRLFVYFAAKHGRPEPELGEAWTAVSRPPYFTALTLWENVGSWYGGGFFQTDRALLLDATCTLEPHGDFPKPKVKVASVAPETAPWELRLRHLGWELRERGFDPRNHRRVGEREVWARPDPGGRFTLFRQVEEWDSSRYGSPYWDTYWLETESDLVPLTDATWADFDGDRLVYVHRGRLMTATLEGAVLDPVELYDFNPLEPTEVPPPTWCRTWPR